MFFIDKLIDYFMKLSILLDTVWCVDSVVWTSQRSVGAGCPSYLCSVARCCDAALGLKLYCDVVS